MTLPCWGSLGLRGKGRKKFEKARKEKIKIKVEMKKISLDTGNWYRRAQDEKKREGEEELKKRKRGGEGKGGEAMAGDDRQNHGG